MPAPIPTSMATILPILKLRLRLVTEFPAERVNVWYGDNDPPHLQADQDLVLRLSGISPDDGWFTGGGRYTPRVTEKVGVTARTRLQLDPSGTIELWLTDPTYGHIALRDMVVNAMAGFMPLDTSGNALTTEAIHPAPAPPPKSDVGRRKPVDWGGETLYFSVSYLYSVDLTLSETAVLEE